MAVSIKRPKFYTFLRLLSSNRSMALKKLGLFAFLRTHRGLFLTAAGASLAEDARYVIQYSKGFHRPGPERAMEQGQRPSASGLRP